MAAKNTIKIISMSASSNQTEVVGTPPLNEVWVIKKFGCADMNTGDNKSSVFILKYGTDNIRIVTLTGAIKELDISHEITGDGTKELKVFIQNSSGGAKQVGFWIDGYSRE